jgi:DNA-binding SARP family transcriptional activator
MRLRLLGPLRLMDGAEELIAVEGPRQRILLAALAAHANQPVSLDTLAEAVWDGSPPPGNIATLRTQLARLRRRLGSQMAQRIVTRARGYAIELDEDELDLLRFESLCRQTGAALRAGDDAQAAASGALALSLWQGKPLTDVPSQLLHDMCVPRLERLRVQVLEDWAEAELRRGRHEAVLEQLRELAARHPLRERFHAQLITALARAGRRAEALEAYQDARRILVQELGIEPGAELQEAQNRILVESRADPAPAERQPASASAPVGVGAPHHLPAAPGHFVGRHSELDLLDEPPGQPTGTGAGGTVAISAIDGMAGIGKTALVVHAAHRIADRFPDGQLFLDLHGYTKGFAPREPAQALEWLLRALGVPAGQIPEDAEARAALYRQRLVGTRTLILLDNALNEAQVRPLLPGAAGSLVLVTSRRRLKGLDDARVVTLDVLPEADAVALLRAMIAPAHATAGEPELTEIVRLCGRLPLAVRIAGALLRNRPAWSLEHLTRLLRNQRSRVGTLSDGERDLGAVFDLSYAGLDERHRLLFRRLGLAPGPETDAYAAAALLGAEPETAAELLEALVDHNLLIEHAPGRYRLHDLIRIHASSLAGHDPADERSAAVDRLLHYYAHTAQSASVLIAHHPRSAPAGQAPARVPALTGSDAARDWLRTERENLETAHIHARESSLDRHAVALAAGLAEILRIDGPRTRALVLHQTAAAIAQRRGWLTAHATALTDLAAVRCLTGDYRGGADAVSQALEIFRKTGDHHGEAIALSNLGTARHLTGDLAGADVAQTLAVEIFRANGDRFGEAYALANLGDTRSLAGGLAGAEDALTRALEIFRAIGHRLGQADALTNLGEARLLAGDLPGAGDALTEALEIFRADGDRHRQASALTMLGTVRRLIGDLPGAVDTVARALEIYREIGSRGNEAWALNHYANAVAATGDTSRALDLYQQALAMNRELNKTDDEAVSLEGLGECHLATGGTETGTTHLEQALELYQRVGMAPDAKRLRARLVAVDRNR